MFREFHWDFEAISAIMINNYVIEIQTIQRIWTIQRLLPQLAHFKYKTIENNNQSKQVGQGP